MTDWKEEAQELKKTRWKNIADGDDSDLVRKPEEWCNELHEGMRVFCRKQHGHEGNHAMFVYSSFVAPYRIEW